MELYEKTEPPVDTQDCYERIRAFLGRPEASRCADNTGNCLYRDNGNRCAIGGILPLDLLDLVGNSSDSVGGLIDTHPEIEAFFRNVDIRFLHAAQDAHDRTTFMDADGIPRQVEDAGWQANALSLLDSAAQSARLTVFS